MPTQTGPAREWLCSRPEAETASHTPAAAALSRSCPCPGSRARSPSHTRSPTSAALTMNRVESATGPGTVYPRDSKLGDACPVLAFSPTEWAAFLSRTKSGPGR
ncbi:DUF397 domain-containing protein [Pseudonocardia spinosispora]|uniref:DUF397 domain-containing protein n=1 Tax=Pseudonocardia spinosispora TaxID=103441 RepID=UPI0024805D52|nr:DUF397 domain-containing protein [Pseudonocardia spinosispora]